MYLQDLHVLEVHVYMQALYFVMLTFPLKAQL